MKFIRLLFALFVVSIALPVAAQDDVQTERVSFASDETVATIHGSITGDGSAEYLVSAAAGQTMVVVLNPSNTATYFNIFEPGRGPGDEALYIGSTQGNQFQGALATSGDYTIQVYMMRSAARRDEQSDYRLDIGLDGSDAPDAQAPSGDFADGLSGGPDFWQVSVSGSLNIRSAPSTGASVLIALPDGTVLRNLGCREAEDRVWCEVAQPDGDGVRGWAAGSFLIESAYVDPAAAPAAAAETPEVTAEATPATQTTEAADMPATADAADAANATDALVPGTPFHATGTLHCAPTMDAAATDCDFGVIRTGNGSGSVRITLPDGGSRTILFEDGEAVLSDGGGQLTFTRIGDTMVINIGQEHYEMPDAVIYGG